MFALFSCDEITSRSHHHNGDHREIVSTSLTDTIISVSSCTRFDLFSAQFEIGSLVSCYSLTRSIALLTEIVGMIHGTSSAIAYLLMYRDHHLVT